MKPASASSTALLLIAHGSREEAANADLRFLAQKLRERNAYPIVEASFLELEEPTIEQGAEKCIQRGAKRVVLLPFFLSAGIHVSRDLTEAQRTLSARYAGIEFLLAEPLGRHPLLADVVMERARGAEQEMNPHARS
jgi:sirohydrochlorin ferrochelatase